MTDDLQDTDRRSSMENGVYSVRRAIASIARAGYVTLRAITTPVVHGDIQEERTLEDVIQEVRRNSEHPREKDEKNPKYNGQHGAFVILLFLCGLSIVECSSTYISDQVTTVFIGINIVLMLSGSVIIFGFLVNSSKLTVQLDVAIQNQSFFKDIMQRHLSLIPIVLFDVIGSILDVFYFIAIYSCNDVWKRCGNSLKTCSQFYLIFHALRVIFFGAVAVFCRNFYNQKFIDSCVVKFGIVVIVATNVSLCFLGMVKEIISTDNKYPEDQRERQYCDSRLNDSRASACLTLETKEYMYAEKVAPYILPITIEYSLLVCENLFSMFFNGSASDDSHNNNSEETPTVTSAITQGNTSDVASVGSRGESQSDYIENNETEITEVLLTDNQRTEPSHSNLYRKEQNAFRTHYCFSGIGIVVCPALCMLYCILSFFDSRLYDADMGGTYRQLFFEYSVFYYSIRTLCIPVGVIICRYFKKTKRTVSGLEYLVMFSVIGLIMDNQFRITSNVNLIKCNYWNPDQTFNRNNTCNLPNQTESETPNNFNSELDITLSIINLVEVMFQAPFLIFCQTVEIPKNTDFPGMRLAFNTVLLFLALSNCVNWFVDSIFHFTSFSPVEIYYGKLYSEAIHDILTPFILFFRFSSMLLFLQVYSRDHK